MRRGRQPDGLKGIDQYDFDALSRKKGNHREKVRYLAFAHIREGKSFTEAAKMVRVELRTLMNWVRKFRKEGIEGLQDKLGRGGAKPYIPRSKQEEFKQSVLELQKSRPGGRVRGTDVIDMIERDYGHRPSLSAVYETLKRVGLVWITGRSKHPKSNEEAQLAFKKSSEKKSKKSCRSTSA